MPSLIDSLYVNIAYRMDKASVARAQASIKTMQTSLNTLSNRLMLGGAGLTGGFAVVGKTIYKVDEALKSLQARGDLTAEQIARAKAEAIRVGSDLPLNTADIINAQKEFVALGLTYEEALAATPTAALAAVATGENIADIAQWMTVIKNTYGLTAEGMANTSDMMVKIAKLSPATFGDIGRSYEHSAQTMKDADVALHEYISLLGLAAGGGKRAEAASQGFQLVLGNVAKATVKLGRGSKMVIDAFDKIGIKQEEMIAAKRTGGMKGLFTLINKSVREIASKEGNVANVGDYLSAFFTQLGGQTYGSTLSYMTQNIDKLEDIMGEVENATGTAAADAEIMMSGMSGAFKKMLAMWDTLQNELGDKGIKKALEDAFNVVTKIMTALTLKTVSGEHENDVILDFIAKLLMAGPLIIGLGLAIRALSFALGGFSFLLTAASALMKPFIWLIGSAGKASLFTRIQLWGLAVAQFTVSAATKTASFALSLFSAAAWRARLMSFGLFLQNTIGAAALMLYRGAVVATTFAINLFRASTWRAVAASIAMRVATVAGAIATAASTTWTVASTVATNLFSVSLWRARLAMLATGAAAMFAGRSFSLAAIGTKLATVAAWLFNAALWANPITWAVAGIIALIAALVALVVYWDEVIAFLKSVFGPALDWLGDKFTDVAEWIGQKWAEAMEWIEELIPDWLKDIFTGDIDVDAEKAEEAEKAARAEEGAVADEKEAVEKTTETVRELERVESEITETQDNVIQFPEQTVEIPDQETAERTVEQETETVRELERVESEITEAGDNVVQFTDPTDQNIEIPDQETETVTELERVEREITEAGDNVVQFTDPTDQNIEIPDQVVAEAGAGFGTPPVSTLPGLQTPLPAAPPDAAQLMRLDSANQSMSRNITVNIDSVVIDTQATDSREIAQNISAELRDQINIAEEAADSNIAM